MITQRTLVFLIKKYKDAKIIFSGGSGDLNKNSLTHSEVAEKYYTQMEIGVERIIYEKKSRNTFENIIYSKEIAKFNNNENWIIITSASHMKRALLI